MATASAAGLLTQIGVAPYAVTKHAAVAFSEWLSVTYGDRGVGVSCLCPMGVATNMLNAEADATALGADVVARAGAILEPEEVADRVLEAIAAETFLVLPHPEVLEFFRRKSADYDRWLARDAPPAGHGVARVSAADTGRSALLVDFGGVLTTSVHGAFRAFAAEVGHDPGLVLRLLAQDPESSQLLVANQNGTIDDATSERGFARRLVAHGVTVVPDGLLRRMQAGLSPDEAMVEALGALRAAGIPVAIVTNRLRASADVPSQPQGARGRL